jgi:hypothetical protein
MRKLLCYSLAATCCVAAPLQAQSTTSPEKSEPAAAQVAAVPTPVEATTAASVPQADSACCKIPALTPVALEILSTVNSQANKIGEKFAIRLTEPIVVDGVTVVPAGTAGSGDVVHAAKSRFGGKPGELIIAVRYLEYLGQRIPLRSLRFGGATGKDNGGAAQAAGIAAGAVGGLVAMFITGGEVNVPAGTLGQAKVATETLVMKKPTEGGATQ